MPEVSITNYVAPFANWFKVPTRGWYRFQIGFTGGPSFPIWRLVKPDGNVGVWESPVHAIAAGAATDEVARLNVGGLWDMTGGGATSAVVLQMDLELRAGDQLESTHLFTAYFMGPNRPVEVWCVA